MTGSLLALEWTAVGGCALMAAVVVGAFVAELVREFRPRPVLAWQPGGPWYPATPRAGEETRPLGRLPEAVERELALLAAMIPDRPA